VRSARQSGFTFVEIIAVVMLIALISTVIVNRIGTRSSAPLRQSGRFLSAELEYVGQRAIATGRPQRWVIDLDRQFFRVEEQPTAAAVADDSGESFSLAAPIASGTWEPIPEKHGEWRALYEDSIGVDSIVISGDVFKVGQAAIHFSPDGGADPADVWMIDTENRQLRVFVTAFTGEVHALQVEAGGA
jgi:prepilin-type N-terminal cleavage/methylation domain-containing protein